MKKIMMLIILWGFLSPIGIVAQTTTFTVNTAEDTIDVNPGDGIAADASGNCSLRAAVMEANARAGTATIVLPEGIYYLTIEGVQEDSCLKGDLDIRSSIMIQGAGKDLSIIDGNRIDRVFHIEGIADVTLLDITIRNGKTPDGGTPPALTAGGSGGGIFNRFATLTIENCQVIHNETGKGGELYDGGISPPGGFGGGIYNKQGTVSIVNSNIENNITGRGGESMYAGGNGGDGGGIFNGKNSILIIQNCEIRKNATGNAAIRGDGEGLNGGSGGGISNSGELWVIDSTISENSCGDGDEFWYGGSGGGIFNSSSGSAEISRSLIDRNVTGFTHDEWGGGYGGGLCNRGGQVTLRNCTISRNRIKENSVGVGGGIYNSGELSLSNCTVYKNLGNRIWAAFAGGGIYNNDSFSLAEIKVKNSIIAKNSVRNVYESPDIIYPDDCYGTITSQGYNLITTTTGCTLVGNAAGNIYGVNPLLGALADNGGPTMTHRLLPGSPAIDTGHLSDFEATDQRGVPRPKDGDGIGGARSDIGAFELFSPSVAIASPGEGESVCGTISIEGDANTEFVDIFIDKVLLYEAVTSPFMCSWDSVLFANGSHKIKAKAYDADVPWLGKQDHVEVIVDNTIFGLDVSRISDRAWIIRREYGSVTFNVTHAGSTGVFEYIIDRREEGGSFTPIRKISESELTGNSFTYTDPLPDKNISYTYRVRAVSAADMIVGISEEKTI